MIYIYIYILIYCYIVPDLFYHSYQLDLYYQHDLCPFPSQIVCFFYRFCSVLWPHWTIAVGYKGVRGEPLQRTLAPAHPACCSIGRPRKDRKIVGYTKHMQNDAKCARSVKNSRFCVCDIIYCIQTMSLELF